MPESGAQIGVQKELPREKILKNTSGKLLKNMGKSPVLNFLNRWSGVRVTPGLPQLTAYASSWPFAIHVREPLQPQYCLRKYRKLRAK
jgi:hypothetical protein